MRQKRVLAAALAAVMALGSIQLPVSAAPERESAFVRAFADPDQKYDPGVRWELPLGNTTKEELERELESFAKAGIGVVEVTATGQPTGKIPEGPDAGQDYTEVYGMGSENWSRILQTILEKANALGIRVDYHVSVNNGSNKHVPGISPNDAAASKELIFVAKKLEGETLPDISAVSPERKTFVSNVDGSAQELEQHLEAVLLVHVAEEKKSVEVYNQLDGAVVVRGGYGHEKFTASYDILDFDKTVDVTALYDKGATEAERAQAEKEKAAANLRDGTWKVMAFWWRGDCNAIKGVTQYPSFKIDYFSTDGTKALEDYYTEEVFRIDQKGFENMKGLLRANGGHIFADSYGANANWSNDLPEAFKAATGQDIHKYLPALFYADSVKGAELGGNGQGVSSGRKYGFGFTDGTETDFLEQYRQVMTDLLIEKQIRPLSEYCDTLGLEYRDQVVYATSRLDMIKAAAYVDVPDVESLNNVDSPDYFTAMASTNHLLGKELISSEHGATYGNTVGCYAYPIRMAINQSNRAFAGGINQLIMHYYTYDHLNYPNTEGAKWPGFSAMGTMFADSWRDNSPKWEHINIMTDYFSRMGYILRSGTVKRDVAVYKESYWWPRHQGIFWADEELGKAGYTYDFLSGGALEFDEAVVKNGVLAADTAEYKAFIFDASDMMRDCQDVDAAKITLAAIEKFAEYAKAGLPIVCVGDYPRELAGLKSSADGERFAAALAVLKNSDKVQTVKNQAGVPAALAALGVIPAAENLAPSEILSYRTKTADNINYYYLYNRSNDYVEGISDNFYNYVDNIKGRRSDGEDIHTRMALTGEGIPYLLNAYTGEITPIAEYEVDKKGRIVVNVDLEVNDAMVVALAPEGILQDGITRKLHGVTESSGSLRYENDRVVLCTAKAGSTRVDLSDGSSGLVKTAEPKTAKLGKWNLDIVSYTNKNDLSAVGSAASEMKYTDITGIQLDKLKGWKELGTVWATVTEEGGSSRSEQVDLASVSGIGTYTTTLTLPGDWSTAEDGLILDIGDPYDTVKLTVNGREVTDVNQMTCKADISGYVRAGENTVAVKTNTTLSNALVKLRPDWYGKTKVNNYGLRADVTAMTYTRQDVTAVSSETEQVKSQLEQAKAEKEKAEQQALAAKAEAEKAAREAREAQQRAEEAIRSNTASQAEITRLKAAAEQALLASQAAQKEAKEAKAAKTKAENTLAKVRFKAKKPTLKKVSSNKKKTAVVSWKRFSGAKGYVVQYATKSNFKGAKKVTVKNGKTTKATIRKLKSNKKYYFRVKAFKKIGGQTVYTANSAVKNVKIK